jgi:uncharacterized protein (TIGR00297 family)
MVFTAVLFLAMWVSIRVKVISKSGAAAGGLVATGMYLGGGWIGVVLLGMFLVAGSLATRWQRSEKEALGVAQESGGQRTWINALANGSVAGVLGLLGWAANWEIPLVFPMMAAAIASATSDTLSSELGNLYGRQYWNIRNWKPGRRGEDGMISLEGTLFGVAGSLLIAIPVGWQTQSVKMAIIVAGAGMIGNWTDSVLGATLQRQGRLNNHTVNFYSTLIAAFAAGLLHSF